MSVCVCAWCGQSFEGKRSDSLFCNPACKQKYWRWKHHLDLSRKIIMVEIDEVEKYLSNESTEHAASLILGEIADRLASMGFLASMEQMALPVKAYTLENQLGGQDE
jgi:hypothetical protein